MKLILGLMLLALSGCSAFFPNGLFPTYYSIAYDVALEDCEARKAFYATHPAPNNHDALRVYYGASVDCQRQAHLYARSSAGTMVSPYPSVYISTPTSTGTVTSAW